MTSAVVTLKRWGDGLGVRLPAAIVRAAPGSGLASPWKVGVSSSRPGATNCRAWSNASRVLTRTPWRETMVPSD